MPRLQVRTFPSRITCAWGANMAPTYSPARREALEAVHGKSASPAAGWRTDRHLPQGDVYSGSGGVRLIRSAES